MTADDLKPADPLAAITRQEDCVLAILAFANTVGLETTGGLSLPGDRQGNPSFLLGVAYAISLQQLLAKPDDTGQVIPTHLMPQAMVDALAALAPGNVRTALKVVKSEGL